MYEHRYDCRFIDRYMPGREADVYVTDRATVVKLFHHEPPFLRELEVYQDLLAKNIVSVNEFAVPVLIRWDDELRAIEMTIVRPPYFLDFAGAKTDEEYQLLVLHDDEWEDQCVERVKENFDDRWPDVVAAADAFARATGWVLMDLHRGNLKFADDQ